jgi:hypothetical protein
VPFFLLFPASESGIEELGNVSLASDLEVTGMNAGPTASARAGPSRAARRRFGVLLAFYGAVGLLMLDHIDDDAFIYFRTAVNIAKGHGYVFNIGGERIETGSSLAWQYLLVLARLLHLDLLLFAKFAGLALGGAALYLLFRVSERVLENEWLALYPPGFLCVSIPFYGWVQRGLETSLYVFSIVLLAFFLVHERYRRLWYVPTLLVALSRSEGFLVLFGLAGFFYFERKVVRRLLPGAVVVGGAFVAVVVFRFVYFHDFFPHPFYVKIQELPGLPLRAALLYFRVTGTWLLVLVGATGLLGKRAWDRNLVTLAVLNLPFLWWGFRTCTLVEYDRYLVPALPLVYVVCARGLDRLASSGRVASHVVRWSSRALGAWLAFGAPAMSLSLNPVPNLLVEALTKAVGDPAGFASRCASILLQRGDPVPPTQSSPDGIESTVAFTTGELIEKSYPRGITIVYDQMGQTPWYAGRDKVFIDTLGLTYRPAGFAFYNERLAVSGDPVQRAYQRVSEWLLHAVFGEPSRELTNQEVVERIFGLRPHLIIVNAFVNPNSQDVPGRIARDPRLSTDYVQREAPWLKFYVRLDLARADERMAHRARPEVPAP